MSDDLRRFALRVAALVALVAAIAFLTGNPVKRYFLIEDYSLPPKPPKKVVIDSTPAD